MSIPSHDTKSAARKQRQKQRWFKELQKWRTGCEGRISVLKRRHGLRRSLYRGPDGIRRWVGLGVIADNLIHIGTHLAELERVRAEGSSPPTSFVGILFALLCIPLPVAPPPLHPLLCTPFPPESDHRSNPLLQFPFQRHLSKWLPSGCHCGPKSRF